MKRIIVFASATLLLAVGAADAPRLRYDPSVFAGVAAAPRLAYDPAVFIAAAGPIEAATAYPPCGGGVTDRCVQGARSPARAAPATAPRARTSEAEPIGM